MTPEDQKEMLVILARLQVAAHDGGMGAYQHERLVERLRALLAKEGG